MSYVWLGYGFIFLEYIIFCKMDSFSIVDNDCFEVVNGKCCKKIDFLFIKGLSL